MKTKLCSLLVFGAATFVAAQQTRIVGGSGTTAGAYPYMTALIEKGATPASGQFCGSALVAPQWVLTAGHCMEGTPASAVEVWIGGRDLRNAAEGIRVGVSQVIMHPNFGENAQGALQYDFCLLKLARAVTERATLPLVEAASQVAAGNTARAIGWGATAEGGSGSQVLLQVDLPLVALSVAGRTIPGLNSTHLAAGRVTGGIDTCQGDSGGPLLVKNAAGVWQHGGTVSFGNGCAQPGEYGIYGNTITVKSWITGYIGGSTTPVDDHSNSTVNATVLATNGTATGNLETGGDADVFKVMLTASGTLTVNSSGSTDVVGSILNSSGTVLSTDDSGAGAPNFRLSYTATAATTVYVKVTGKTTTTVGGYGLTTSFGSTPPSTGDIDVRNGTASVALGGSIAFGTTAVGGAGVNKTITLANTGLAALAINGVSVSTGSYTITTQPAASIAAGKTTSFNILFKPSAAANQSATLTIISNDPDENPFTLTLSGSGQGAGDDHGNSIATATRVSLPSSTAGSIGTGTDLDYFSFVVSASRSVTIKTTGTLDTYGTLYDASGRQLVAADDTSATNYNFTITRTLAPGTYYVAVEGYSTSDLGAYTFIAQ